MQGMLEAVMNRANSKGVIRTLLGRKCRFDLWEPTSWGVHKPLPLNQAKVEYGDAIKQLIAANIFPGDLLYKNFGLTKHGRVVFYDYDEIQYITDCNFRRVPPPRTPEDELSEEPWYKVGPNDVFPEEFETFLLSQHRINRAFKKHHAELLLPEFWVKQQKRIEQGFFDDVFPYPSEQRFSPNKSIE